MEQDKSNIYLMHVKCVLFIFFFLYYCNGFLSKTLKSIWRVLKFLQITFFSSSPFHLIMFIYHLFLPCYLYSLPVLFFLSCFPPVLSSAPFHPSLSSNSPPAPFQIPFYFPCSFTLPPIRFSFFLNAHAHTHTYDSTVSSLRSGSSGPTWPSRTWTLQPNVKQPCRSTTCGANRAGVFRL